MAEAVVIDGAAAAFDLRQKIAEEVERLRDVENLTPGLALVMVGEVPVSELLVRTVSRHAKGVGIACLDRRLPADAHEDDLLLLIRGLNKNRKVHGLIVLRPLPETISMQAVIDAIDPAKDVDGVHVVNAGRLMVGGEGLVSCTALACLRLLKGFAGDLAGRRAVVIGRSGIVGKPAAQLLLRENCTVVQTHSRTRDLPEECRRADIVVAAVGKPGFVKADWIKPGAIVIDVGINRVEEKSGDKTRVRIVGDVDFEAVRRVAGAVTPVPGGVGPVAIACQLANTVIAACRQNDLDAPTL
jgi:methylenetetrahydrofolate dehydrogenase (NADP+)/methenyltetrahydrofolate cyclohydrolase